MLPSDVALVAGLRYGLSGYRDPGGARKASVHNHASMIEPLNASTGSLPTTHQNSLLVYGTALLRRRRLIGSLIAVGAILGVISGLMQTRQYLSSATFIPQSSDAGVPAGLALAASQIGVRMPSTGNSWGPPIYVELLHSRSLLEPMALEPMTVAEEHGRRASLMDLLEIKGDNSAERVDQAVKRLATVVTANEERTLGAVKLSVKTPWPSVSLALVQRLIAGVNEFNLKTRKSQATAERQFADVQTSEAEAKLRSAEDRLRDFLTRNRSFAGAQELVLEGDRLRRDIALRQQVFTSLVQSREEARLREVRDTPVITVLEPPRLAVVGESRKTVVRAILGMLTGGLVGVLIVFLSQGAALARHAPNDASREFFDLVDGMVPSFLRRGRRDTKDDLLTRPRS
jgi:uncharacterized protein involved in exopolysaccharide biosynthesis